MTIPPNIAALLGQGGAQPAAPADWWSYGRRPQMAARPAMAGGGKAPARGALASDQGGVKGPGTGREDAIPAALSDGEFVVDAESVALLGDGSTDAGIDKLEAMRSNLRKHKGRALAKGAISDDALAPEAYMKKGR